jgi:hypothetical protein
MGGSAGWLYFEHVKQEKEQKRRLWNILTHDRYSTFVECLESGPSRMEMCMEIDKAIETAADRGEVMGSIAR